MRELTFNITEDKRYLVEPTNVENFNLTFDKPNWVQGRVGEDSLRQVFVNVVTGPNNEPYDLSGINPEFDGLTAKGGPENRNYVVIDNHHSVMIDAQGGRFRFDFPKEAFAIAGSYKQAFFSLKREGTGEVVATLEFDMKVMANFVYETVKAVDYITPFDDVLDQLLEKYKQGNADREEQFNQFITNIQTQYNSIKSQFEASEALANALDERLKALESQIQSDQLYTKSEGEALEQSVSSQLATLTNAVDTKLQSSVKHLADIPSLVSSNLETGEVVKVLNNYGTDGIAQTFSIKTSKPSSGLWFQLTNGKYACEVQGYRDFIPKIMSQPLMTLADNDLTAAKGILDNFSKRGYDGFVLDVHMDWDDRSGFSTREDLAILRQAFEYSQSKGFTTTAIKVHYIGAFTADIAQAYSGYITSTILPALSSLGVDKVVVLNERKETVDKYHSDLIPQFKQLVQNIQNMGYQVGISYENDVALSGAVANNGDLMRALNFIGCNLYPTIGAYERGITASDVKEAFDESVGNIAPALQLGKPFYVTETGIRPYNQYFGSPSNYGHDDSTNPDFTVFTRYFEGVFNSGLKSVAVEVWDWHAWDNDIPAMTKLIKGKRGVI